MTRSETTGYEAVIGLEVHAQLRTRTKIFCACATEAGQPNDRTCPVCLGLPGALPVLNREAVRMAIQAGLATGCSIQGKSLFARKNYFYPDLPKGYQISQADAPICVHGSLPIATAEGPRRIGIQRIHLEEDAGKSMHGPGGTLVDLGRAGTPLIEIVGQPDLRTPDEAAAYLRELRAILVFLGVCDGNMEAGNFRCDANVSVRRVGEVRLGTRCEIKNMNSFRSVRDAIAYEIDRQVALVEAGERVVQQTRLWSQDTGRTEPMRSKEEAHDYRYFPDPDLLPLVLDPAEIDRLRASLPPLPAQLRQRLQDDLGLTAAQAETLTDDPDRLAAFERALGSDRDAKRAATLANFLTMQVSAALNRSTRTWAQVAEAGPQVAAVCERWRSGGLTNKMLADLLTNAFGDDRPLHEALAAHLAQVGEVVQDAGQLEAVVDDVIARFPKEVEKYRGGQKQIHGFFVGQVMKALQGKGNAQLAGEIVRKKLEG